MIRFSTLLAMGALAAGCASAAPKALPTMPALPASPDLSRMATDVVEPTTTVTLSDALALALLRSPNLAAYSWQIRASEARILQATLRPNPEVSLLVEDVLGTGRFEGGREAQVTLEISQAIELGGKRAARAAEASAARELTNKGYELERVDVLADVTRKFIRVLSAQHLLAAADATVKLAEETVAAVARRVEVGAGSALEERKARIDLARGRIVGEHAHHELAVARRALAASWGGAEEHYQRVEGDLFGRKPVPPYAALSPRLSKAPEMLRQAFERRLREAEIRLAETKRVSNVTVLGGIRRLEGQGDESFVFGVALPLPTSDRNQGGLAEARALLSKSEASGRAAATRLQTVVFGLHQELLHASIALDALDREILPQSEASLALARRGFAEGRFSYLELVDAQRTLGAVKRERIETAESYHGLVLELERLLGAPLNDGTPPAGIPTGDDKAREK